MVFICFLCLFLLVSVFPLRSCHSVCPCPKLNCDLSLIGGTKAGTATKEEKVQGGLIFLFASVLFLCVLTLKNSKKQMVY